MTKYCPECGSPAADAARFCMRCGRPFFEILGADEPAAEVPTMVPAPLVPRPPNAPTPVPSEMPPVFLASEQRPGCIAMYAVFMMLVAIAALLGTVLYTGIFSDVSRLTDYVSGTGISVLLIGLAVAAVHAAVATGVYRLRAWGRAAAIIVHGLGVAGETYVLFRVLDLRSFLYDLCRTLPGLCPFLEELGVSFSLTGPLTYVAIAIALHLVTLLWFLMNGDRFR